MLYYDKLDLSEGIDLTKNDNSRKCMACHYCCFNHVFKFQDCVCNSFHDLLILCVNIGGFAIITVKNVGYCCIIHDISKSEAINLLKSCLLENREYI